MSIKCSKAGEEADNMEFTELNNTEDLCSPASLYF